MSEISAVITFIVGVVTGGVIGYLNHDKLVALKDKVTGFFNK